MALMHLLKNGIVCTQLECYNWDMAVNVPEGIVLSRTGYLSYRQYFPYKKKKKKTQVQLVKKCRCQHHERDI